MSPSHNIRREGGESMPELSPEFRRKAIGEALGVLVSGNPISAEQTELLKTHPKEVILISNLYLLEKAAEGDTKAVLAGIKPFAWLANNGDSSAKGLVAEALTENVIDRALRVASTQVLGEIVKVLTAIDGKKAVSMLNTHLGERDRNFKGEIFNSKLTEHDKTVLQRNYIEEVQGLLSPLLRANPVGAAEVIVDLVAHRASSRAMYEGEIDKEIFAPATTRALLRAFRVSTDHFGQHGEQIAANQAFKLTAHLLSSFAAAGDLELRSKVPSQFYEYEDQYRQITHEAIRHLLGILEPNRAGEKVGQYSDAPLQSGEIKAFTEFLISRISADQKLAVHSALLGGCRFGCIDTRSFDEKSLSQVFFSEKGDWQFAPLLDPSDYLWSHFREQVPAMVRDELRASNRAASPQVDFLAENRGLAELSLKILGREETAALVKELATKKDTLRQAALLYGALGDIEGLQALPTPVTPFSWRYRLAALQMILGGQSPLESKQEGSSPPLKRMEDYVSEALDYRVGFRALFDRERATKAARFGARFSRYNGIVEGVEEILRDDQIPSSAITTILTPQLLQKIMQHPKFAVEDVSRILGALQARCEMPEGARQPPLLPTNIGPMPKRFLQVDAESDVARVLGIVGCRQVDFDDYLKKILGKGGQKQTSGSIDLLSALGRVPLPLVVESEKILQLASGDMRGLHALGGAFSNRNVTLLHPEILPEKILDRYSYASRGSAELARSLVVLSERYPLSALPALRIALLSPRVSRTIPEALRNSILQQLNTIEGYAIRSDMQ